jgi:hypothetical protein
VAGARLVTARRLTLALFLVGLGLLAVGAAIFFWQFPHSPGDYGWFAYGKDPEPARYADWSMGWPGTEGDLRLSLAGAAVAGAGFLVILVPIIAWGVRLGQSSARPDQS